MSLERKEQLKEAAYADCIKYGTPTPGVDHGLRPATGPLVMTEATKTEFSLYKCNFCGCLTNARQRMCCEAGRMAYKEKK